MIWNFPFVAVVILIALGLYTIIFKRNLIKIVIGIELIESGVNLFLITLGYIQRGVSPIYTYAPGEKMVLPTPQALTLTSIVIGLATTALMLSFTMRIYKHYRTADARKVRLKG